MKVLRKFRFAILALVGISSLVTSCQRKDNQNNQPDDHEHTSDCDHYRR